MYVHALRSRCAVAVSSGADGVALAQFSTFLYDSTYLVLPKTRRIHHRKAHQILRQNGGARRVASRRRCASSCCFVSLASLAAHTYKGQTLDFLVIVYYYCLVQATHTTLNATEHARELHVCRLFFMLVSDLCKIFLPYY